MITIDEAIEFCIDSATSHPYNVAGVTYIWNGYEVPTVFTDIASYLTKYKENRGVPNKITKLYAIENIATGEIIFNARGGAYKKPEEALAKLDKLEDGKYRLVTYELKGE